MRLRRSLIAVAGAAVTALALAACSAASADPAPEAAGSGAAGGFPVTIEHAFGETVVEHEPERVATWGWGSTEAAIAVGVHPVAIAEQAWTVGEGNYLPWVEAAYEEAGEELPTLIPDPEGGATVPYEEFIAAEPDLILAPYSGLTEEQYETLSEIAPVIAYPEAPWTTSWDRTIEITAEALGRADEGAAVLAHISDGLAEQAAAHPDFAGTTFAGVWDGDGFVYVYTAADPRIEVLTELGLEVAPSVSELDTSDGGFYYELSYEQLDQLDADVIVSYHGSREEADAFLAKPELQAIPAVAAGAVAQVHDPVTVSSVSPPTALSFDWEGGLPALIDAISGVVEQ
ncbi:iron-siderophore ABC transporter substrate-binding protein [Agromyces binzhouensis]|uniref:Iron-siderophore ABC transporter substrate-binding protein n=1 Tax=Agromyces binzhouensis TaxID=1817495 RepID=A0A4Q2JBA8_9MICO|nr:iron-siderophore ABC transporter substrate-binding protein [Agromyces binzhouensis]RXZ43066.1 iron-siderophore ABC transporter substrate-binding protein [Agromyces binzhouensis]